MCTMTCIRRHVNEDVQEAQSSCIIYVWRVGNITKRGSKDEFEADMKKRRRPNFPTKVQLVRIIKTKSKI